MIRRGIRTIGDRFFLWRQGVRAGQRVSLETRKNIFLGQDLILGDDVAIRSRMSSALIHIGNAVRIRQGCEINAKNFPFQIGDNCFLAKNTWIGGCGAITIGSNVMIGIGTILVSSDHDYINVSTPYYDTSEISKPIEVGDDVWIGSNCVVLGGSSIGNGSVVGAGSVVNGDFPDNSFIVGVPGEVKFTIQRESPA